MSTDAHPAHRNANAGNTPAPQNTTAEYQHPSPPLWEEKPMTRPLIVDAVEAIGAILRVSTAAALNRISAILPPLEGGFFMPKTEPQPAKPKTTPQLRARYALRQARLFRHTPDCVCGVFNGYCNADDQMWSERVDRELESIR